MYYQVKFKKLCEKLIKSCKTNGHNNFSLAKYLSGRLINTDYKIITESLWRMPWTFTAALAGVVLSIVFDNLSFLNISSQKT